MDSNIVPFSGSQTSSAEDRSLTAGRIRFIADQVESGNWDLRGYAIIGLTNDGPPKLDLGGKMDWEDLEEVQSVVRDIHSCRWTGGDILETVGAGWARRKAYWEAKEAEAAAFESEHPWLCEKCDRRFKTERGAVQHERSCGS